MPEKHICPKMTEFYMTIALKIFLRFIFFLGGGGACVPCLRLLCLWKGLGGDKSPAWSSQNLGSTVSSEHFTYMATRQLSRDATVDVLGHISRSLDCFTSNFLRTVRDTIKVTIDY